jgi:hypothetical protein
MSYINIFLDANLTPQTDTVRDSRFASDPNLGSYQAIFANDNPMPQMDLVIQFGAFTQDGIAGYAFVNGASCPNFDVVMHNNPAATQEPVVMPIASFFVIESIGTQDRIGMDYHTVSQDGVRIEDDIGMDNTGFTDANPVPQNHTLHDDGVLSDLDIVPGVVMTTHGIAKGAVPANQAVVNFKWFITNQQAFARWAIQAGVDENDGCGRSQYFGVVFGVIAIG